MIKRVWFESWGTVLGSLPAPLGEGEADAPGHRDWQNAIARDALLLLAGFGLLVVAAEYHIPGWEYMGATPLFWAALCLVSGTLGLARGILAVAGWVIVDLRITNGIWQDISLNINVPGLRTAEGNLAKIAWVDWGHWSAVLGAVIAAVIIARACDLGVDRDPVRGIALMVGAVGLGKLIGTVGFAIALGVQTAVNGPQELWSLAVALTIGELAPTLLGGAFVVAVLLAALRRGLLGSRAVAATPDRREA